MSARTEVAAHLTQALPSYTVVPFPQDPDRVSGVTVLVWRSQVQRGPVKGARSSDIVVWVLSGHEDPRKAEDALDTALDAVLAALDDLDASSWDTAERGVYADRFNGYRITLPIATTT